MDRWDSVSEMVRDIRIATLKVAGVLAGILLLNGDLRRLLGLLVGALLSLWQFGSLASSTEKVVRMPPEQAKIQAVLRYLVRFTVVAVALATIYFTTELDFVSAVIGLFLVKLVIIGYAVREAFAAGGAAYLRQLANKRLRREGKG